MSSICNLEYMIKAKQTINEEVWLRLNELVETTEAIRLGHGGEPVWNALAIAESLGDEKSAAKRNELHAELEAAIWEVRKQAICAALMVGLEIARKPEFLIFNAE